MNYLPILFLLSISLQGLSQGFQYTPSKSDLPSKRQFEERMELNLARDIEALQSSKSNRAEIEEIYKSRAEYIDLMATEEDEYIFGTPLNQYVDSIFQRLIHSNPNFDPSRSRLFISRSLAPNASCFGEGTIVINIGLIRRMENESQLAFILAHELAHLQEDHVNRAIIEYVEVKNDKETQKEIRRITRMKYGRNEAGIGLMKDVMYDSSRHSRLHEGEADMKALPIMANAGYDIAEAAEALRILDTVDEEKYTTEIDIIDAFNRELYPFKPEWLDDDNPLAVFFEEETDEEGLFNIHKDSLKTHPNTIERAKRVEKKVSAFPAGALSVQPVSMHEKAIMQADFDLVLSAYHYDRYGYAIYQSLQLQEKYPDHPFLVGIIGACMGEMAVAIDDHELGKILAHTSPAFDDNFNDLLSFLNNLSMKEMTEVAYNYVRIYSDKADQSEALAYALALTSALKDKNNERNKYRNIYNKNFSDGYFIKKVRRIS